MSGRSFYTRPSTGSTQNKFNSSASKLIDSASFLGGNLDFVSKPLDSLHEVIQRLNNGNNNRLH